ncbi:MAG: lysylphosphatidylglycerol synthase transmembrane domain-containing protein [Gemmatimonadales bacterium]
MTVRSKFARLAAVLLLGALLIVAVRQFALDQVVAALAAARPGWLLLAVAIYFSILPVWTLQWSILAPVAQRPPFWRMLGVIAMTSSVLNTTPMLVGETAGVVLLVTRAGLARAAALSVLAMDQLLVGMAKVGVLVLAAWLLVLPAWMERGLRALSVVVLALLVALLGVAWGSRTVDRVARRLPERASHLLRAVAAALAPLRSPSRGGGALAIALAKKVIELAAIVCIQRAFGVVLPFASAVLVLATLNLATLVPVVPGNVGVYEAVVVLAYAHLGVGADRALGIALAQHACYFAALALPGYAWLGRTVPSRSAAAAP